MQICVQFFESNAYEPKDGIPHNSQFSIFNLLFAFYALLLFSCSDFSRTDPDELGLAWTGDGGTSSSSSTASGLAISYGTLDYSAQTYKTVTIGTQTLMAENLNIGTMVSGSAIIADQADDDVIEKYCYNDTESNCDTDGGLYQWAEAIGLASTCNSTTCATQISTGHHQGICPTGWHIPKTAEWDTLATYLGGSDLAGKTMKLNNTGYTDWDASTYNDGNSSGFSALPAGYRSSGGGFYNRGDIARFWEASEKNASNANNRYVFDGFVSLYAERDLKVSGFSVRCFKD